MSIITHGTAKFEVEQPDYVLMALIDAELATTTDEASEALAIVEAWDAETAELIQSAIDTGWFRG